ncbi:GNAT family N-acetyltransferase [Kitasatospora sp. LaBMicrA B282]|uniref:GNAT family N-acetyltransferase n=1 Tax=Kitasatospora sp. LaBMicrA B282 TaxID=3420949 RepID=UPI003D0DA1F7
MTTTLRPAGPEQRLPDGGRDRSWLVCANGHPVGRVRTAATPHGSHLLGRIEDLEITESPRRGRGTVAALAAEEVLRSWDCRWAEVRIPAGAAAALSLAAALGYAETNRNLVKRLGPPPAPRPGLTLRPIDAVGFPAWLAAAQAEYRDQLVRSGLTPAEAAAKCAAAHTHLLPDGHASADTALRELLADGRPVGRLWVALHSRPLPDGTPSGWVMTVDVDPAERGKGFGRELMLAAERECLAAGLPALGLNVYTANVVALGLYASLGYRVVRRIFGKAL